MTKSKETRQPGNSERTINGSVPVPTPGVRQPSNNERAINGDVCTSPPSKD